MATWTPERRAKMAALMHDLQPWKKSTGPKTPEGKARSSRNSARKLVTTSQAISTDPALAEYRALTASMQR